MSSINGEFVGLIVEQQPEAVKGSEEKAEEKVAEKKAAPKKSAKK